MDHKRKHLLELLKARCCGGRSAADDRQAKAQRLHDIAARAGGVNRLAALLRFHRQLEAEKPARSRLDPSDN